MTEHESHQQRDGDTNMDKGGQKDRKRTRGGETDDDLASQQSVQHARRDQDAPKTPTHSPQGQMSPHRPRHECQKDRKRTRDGETDDDLASQVQSVQRARRDQDAPKTPTHSPQGQMPPPRPRHECRSYQAPQFRDHAVESAAGTTRFQESATKVVSLEASFLSPSLLNGKKLQKNIALCGGEKPSRSSVADEDREISLSSLQQALLEINDLIAEPEEEEEEEEEEEKLISNCKSKSF